MSDGEVEGVADRVGQLALLIQQQASDLADDPIARHRGDVVAADHRSVVEAYGHANLGFTEKELRRFAEKAGLALQTAETVTREKRPPHFEVISLIAKKP